MIEAAGFELEPSCGRERYPAERESAGEILSEVEGPAETAAEENSEILVEAAGVEPASENVTGQKPTCVVAFLPQALPWDVRGRRSERTRNGCR